ncbi:hypothetical protein FB451DRAFT_1163973 [Mycena latifolia]|nr:hypothetical protein FB451DRAFT_1163973 [Mycena latifolia]
MKRFRQAVLGDLTSLYMAYDGRKTEFLYGTARFKRNRYGRLPALFADTICSKGVKIQNVDYVIEELGDVTAFLPVDGEPEGTEEPVMIQSPALIGVPWVETTIKEGPRRLEYELPLALGLRCRHTSAVGRGPRGEIRYVPSTVERVLQMEAKDGSCTTIASQAEGMYTTVASTWELADGFEALSEGQKAYIVGFMISGYFTYAKYRPKDEKEVLEIVEAFRPLYTQVLALTGSRWTVALVQYIQACLRLGWESRYTDTGFRKCGQAA